jgi:hypothetical protein
MCPSRNVKADLAFVVPFYYGAAACLVAGPGLLHLQVDLRKGLAPTTWPQDDLSLTQPLGCKQLFDAIALASGPVSISLAERFV